MNEGYLEPPEDDIPETLLREMSEELGAEWRAVGTYLGIKNSRLGLIQEQHSVPVCIHFYSPSEQKKKGKQNLKKNIN